MLYQAVSSGARLSMSSKKTKYTPPAESDSIELNELLSKVGRGGLQEKQLDLLRSKELQKATIYYAGDLALLQMPSVAIVGSRSASYEGCSRASRLAKELVAADVVVVSGLAKGIDAIAHRSAVENGGRTIGVIGTPLEKAYPAENAPLQEEIYRNHLLLSPFGGGEPVYKSSFPKRNRVMAALSDATVIVEASDTSGTLHQAAECQRLGRWLFIAKSLIEDSSLTWPSKFLGKPKTAILSSTLDIVNAIRNENDKTS